MAILMITYDTEMYGSEVPAFRAYLGDRADDPTITKRWIETANGLHSRYQAPCTSAPPTSSGSCSKRTSPSSRP
jgi:hypothetical protein